MAFSTATLVSAGLTAGAFGAGFAGALCDRAFGRVAVRWAVVFVGFVGALLEEPPSEVTAKTAVAATTITPPAISAALLPGERLAEYTERPPSSGDATALGRRPADGAAAGIGWAPGVCGGAPPTDAGAAGAGGRRMAGGAEGSGV
ncbi:MAG: hypothetical protein ACLPUT_18870, partial [Solirubrobacteraceae bacterium]